MRGRKRRFAKAFMGFPSPTGLLLRCGRVSASRSHRRSREVHRACSDGTYKRTALGGRNVGLLSRSVGVFIRATSSFCRMRARGGLEAYGGARIISIHQKCCGAIEFRANCAVQVVSVFHQYTALGWRNVCVVPIRVCVYSTLQSQCGEFVLLYESRRGP